MSRRRSHYRKNYIQPLQCPQCQGPLSRLSGQRYRLCAELLAGSRAHRDRVAWVGDPGLSEPDIWLEEFYCLEDGRLWMAVRRQMEGRLQVQLPDVQLWKRAIGTVALDRNPSVGEFSWRESRAKRGR